MNIQLFFLKYKLRVLYRTYCAFEHDCGNAIGKVMSGHFTQTCRELNETLDKLAALDPATPTQRF